MIEGGHAARGDLVPRHAASRSAVESRCTPPAFMDIEPPFELWFTTLALGSQSVPRTNATASAPAVNEPPGAWLASHAASASRWAASIQAASQRSLAVGSRSAAPAGGGEPGDPRSYASDL